MSNVDYVEDELVELASADTSFGRQQMPVHIALRRASRGPDVGDPVTLVFA